MDSFDDYERLITPAQLSQLSDLGLNVKPTMTSAEADALIVRYRDFAPSGAVVADVSGVSGKGDVLGYVMVCVPFCVGFLIWFWVGGMSLVQNPSSSLSLLMALAVLATSVLVGVDANQLGVGGVRDLDKKGKRKSGPLGWFVLCLLLWVIVFPVYLFHRGKYGVKDLALFGFVSVVVLCFSSFAVSYGIERRLDEMRNIQIRGDAEMRELKMEADALFDSL